MNKIFLTILIILFFTDFGSSQVKKIIIDTDCGFDDFSAITMFMSMQNVEIIAITSCGGNLDAKNGFNKIYNLIKTANDSLNYNFDISQIFIGDDSKTGEVPSWRPYIEAVTWGYSPNPTFDFLPLANKNIPQIFENSEDEIYYICLGPFTNLSTFIKENENISEKIKKVYWYNGSISDYGFNYEYDKKSAEFIFSQDLIIDVITNLDIKTAYYDEDFKTEIFKIESLYSNLITVNLDNENNHYQTLWDEIIPVYFHYPEIFEMLPDKENPKISINTNFNIDEVKLKMLKIWQNDIYEESNVVFELFPTQLSNFKYDVAAIADSVLTLYGKEEWKACVLTNEFHQHLGIYSIIGTKMGIFALEYLKCKKDRLLVISYAGNQPPVSCLNDGLQMSTGATLGYGTISVSQSSDILPEADFIYGDKKIHLKLKPEYVEQINSDIENGILTYGNLTDGYWKLIRILGIKYWLEWDRNNIFEITEIK